jgi:hypothetical protein
VAAIVTADMKLSTCANAAVLRVPIIGVRRAAISR